jgi:hypothetical protein
MPHLPAVFFFLFARAYKNNDDDVTITVRQA